jgi:hypothetical protein
MRFSVALNSTEAYGAFKDGITGTNAQSCYVITTGSDIQFIE